MKKITTAVISYNAIPPYESGVTIINGRRALILPNTFNPKFPASVLPADPNWSLLLRHRDELCKIIIFAGKKESGALEIIDLAARSFCDKKETLFFILCDHEIKEKTERLAQCGIPGKQYICFSDSHERCRETPFLLGFMHDYIENGQAP